MANMAAALLYLFTTSFINQSEVESLKEEIQSVKVENRDAWNSNAEIPNHSN